MIKFFKKEKSFRKRHFQPNPNFYWKLAVYGVFVISLFSSFFGYYLFKQTDKEPAISSSGNIEQEAVPKERIEKALEYFSEREKKSNQILNSPSPFVDPSM